MYVPRLFEVTDTGTLHDFIRNHGFATVVSVVDGRPLATHLPLLLDENVPGPARLLGHFARGNPHWRALDGAGETLVVFQGPHGYVTPSWYSNHPAVPTWNYTALHVYGQARAVDDPAWLSELVDRMVAFYESGMPEPWPGRLPAEFREKMLSGIVGFALEIERIEGKFKLSQNRPREDRAGVVRALQSSPRPADRELGAFMRAHPGASGDPGTDPD